uniref:SCAN box domain-containing protein n=1 Tax=Gouania willdenowi TaxID=441366 RepID=A0A8C5EVC6_GOUWI
MGFGLSVGGVTSFMEVQRARDERMEKESTRQAKQFQVLNHQVVQLQLDLEATRERARIPQPPPSRPATPEPPAVNPRGRAYELKMAKLEDSDNIEHYLTTYERLAGVYEWWKEEWAIHLIPLLTGKARSAFVAMDPDNTTDYDLLKEAVLKKYEINSETYRLQFRAMETSPTETPQELYIRLKDLFCKWTRFEQCTKEGLMEKMVLEQYLRVLYPELKIWVKEHSPATAAEAAKLVENFVAAHRGPRTYRYAGTQDVLSHWLKQR